MNHLTLVDNAEESELVLFLQKKLSAGTSTATPSAVTDENSSAAPSVPPAAVSFVAKLKCLAHEFYFPFLTHRPSGGRDVMVRGLAGLARQHWADALRPAVLDFSPKALAQFYMIEAQLLS